MHTQSSPASISCPEPACPAQATIIDRWSWPSTNGPVDHVRTHFPSGHIFTPTTDSLAFGHAQTSQGATGWVLLHPAGLEHEGPHRRPPFAQPAGDQPQRLTSPPPRPQLVLLLDR